VLERSNLGPVLREFELAYNLGDPQAARKYLGMGKMKTTKYVVKFDILKTEQVAQAQQSFDGHTLGQMAGWLGRFADRAEAPRGEASAARRSVPVHSGEATSVWVIGMRYKIINAETTEQLAQGYTEEKMEVGATSSGALGVNSAQRGGAGLDTMVQRLIRSRCGKSTPSTSDGRFGKRMRDTCNERAAQRLRSAPHADPMEEFQSSASTRSAASSARRDGRRLRGLRSADRARRRAEDHPPRGAGRARKRRRSGALPPRGAGRREAHASNIVGIYEFGEDAGVWYIAMELVKGRELKDYFEQHERFRHRRHRAHPVADPLGARLLAQARRRASRHQAVERVHAADGSVKVADFGIAHVDSSQLTQVGSVLGTPAYMSPGADPGHAGGRSFRPILGRRDPLSVPHRRAAVRGQRHRDDAQGARRRPATAVALQHADQRALWTPSCGARWAKKADERFQTAGSSCRRWSTQPRPNRTQRRHHDDARCSGGGGDGDSDASATPAKPTAPARKSQAAAMAVVGGIVVIAAVAGSGVGVAGGAVRETMCLSSPPRPCQGAPPDAAPGHAVAAGTPAPCRPVAAGAGRRGDLRGRPVDASDARYQSDKALLQADLRADSRSQLVEKAVSMLVERKSLAEELRRGARQAPFRAAAISSPRSCARARRKPEGRPRVAHDGSRREREGRAEVAERDVAQRARRVHSRERRPARRRAHRDARRGPARMRPRSRRLRAENILKDRIKSFGFRTWSEGSPARRQERSRLRGPKGEATIKRLSMKLDASVSW
jgi:hypothetical protein